MVVGVLAGDREAGDGVVVGVRVGDREAGDGVVVRVRAGDREAGDGVVVGVRAGDSLGRQGMRRLADLGVGLVPHRVHPEGSGDWGGPAAFGGHTTRRSRRVVYEGMGVKAPIHDRGIVIWQSHIL